MYACMYAGRQAGRYICSCVFYMHKYWLIYEWGTEHLPVLQYLHTDVYIKKETDEYGTMETWMNYV